MLLLAPPERYAPGEFSEAVVLVRANSARAGIDAADRMLADLAVEPVGIELTTRVLAEQARSASIASGFTRWVETNKPAFAEMTKREAAAVVQARVDRIATTESARAFNEGLLEESRRSAALAGVRLYRTWNAYADSCPLCAEMDGTRVDLFASFSGDEPGHVHPNCRCTDEITT